MFSRYSGFSALLFLLVFQVQAQRYERIPKEYLSHPELGLFKHDSKTQDCDYELIHERTAYSRTFVNTNGTKTTVQASQPLHYFSQDGFWFTRSYSLSDEGAFLAYPKQEPQSVLDKQTLQNTMIMTNGSVKWGANKNIRFLNNDGQSVVAYANMTGVLHKNENQIVVNNLVPGIDWRQQFLYGAVKTDYLLNNKNSWPTEFTKMLFEEELELPQGWVLEFEYEQGVKTNRLLVKDQSGQLVLIWQHPVVSDSKSQDVKSRYTFQPHQANYEFVQIGVDKYLIRLALESSWLNDASRVFPIIVDPIVTQINTDVINSCFHPNFQQAALSVNVPAGETIFSSDIKYNFVAVAGSQGWMSDQVSFVTGPNGQTATLTGTGDQEGTFVYNIFNSSIANVVSGGHVSFTFNFARTWGGSGCNATFNLVNYREIVVHHGLIQFGDGPIFINEYSASNREFVDGFNRTEDWIEIYNAHPTAFFDMTGFHLSNDITNPTKWQIPGGFIAPNSRILVFCSERNIASGMVFHANFDLTQLRPDQIVLADPQGNILEAHEMFVTQVNHSYGRLTDGGSQWGVFSTPTPFQPNTGGFAGYTAKPTLNVQAGHYTNPVTVSMAVDGNFQIRYTTNGSTPGPTSTLYTGPINIPQTSVIRARAFSSNPNLLPGFIETNTYLINENHTLPIFSFAGDANMLQLFNGNASLRPIGNFEYFEKDGSFIDENLGDFNKHGNDSWNYPQRGVDFISRDDYGYKRRLEHKFFETSNRTRFRRLMVKAAANDNYPFENGGAHIRDSYIQTLSQLAGLDLDERTSTNIILYVNGLYWGVYDLRERVDDNNYTEFYYGQDYLYRDSDIYLQFLKTWGATNAHFGNQQAITDWVALRNYIQNNNMGDANHFAYVDGQLDIQSMIDYFVINSFVVARDWLNYNTGWWRGLDPSGDAQKWRYILWDMEASTGHFHNYTGLPNTGPTAPPCQVENINVGNGHAQSLKKLIDQNPQVRQMYVTRYIDLLNTHFSCDNIIHVLDSMVNNIAPEMPRQIQRWGGNMATWQANVQTLRNWLTTRCNHLMNSGLASCYNLTGPFATTFNVYPENAGKIKMNSEWLASFPFNAQLFGNIQTQLEIAANTGYVFSHWEVDGAVITPGSLSPEIVLEISQATTITAHFTPLISPDNQLIHYWHFNTLDTPNDVVVIPADYSIIQGTTPLMRYTGSGPRDMDAVDTGSDINLHLSQPAGRAVRVRNPSEGRSLVFDMPTSGYKDIKFAYAVERTNQGMLKNIISYSIDGTQFSQANLSQVEFDITPGYDLVFIDFTDIPAVNNNPNFRIRIQFIGNTQTSSGNNRFDNISLKGIQIESQVSIASSELYDAQIFPNPTNNLLEVRSSHVMNNLEILDLSGKKVLNIEGLNQKHTQISFADLHNGVYMIRIQSDAGIKTLRVVKQ